MASLSHWLGLKSSKRKVSDEPTTTVQVEEPKEPKKLSKKEIEVISKTLAEENSKLREELQKLASQLREKTPRGGQSYDGKSTDLYKQLETNLKMDSPTDLVDLTEFSAKYKTSSTSSTSSTTSSTSTTSSSEVETDSRKAVLVCLPAKDDFEEDQVCMVDLTEAEWWTIVDSARDREIEREDADTYVECELAAESTTDDDDSYLLVEEKHLGDALSNYVAQSILKKFPEAKGLTEKQLNKLIDSSFNGLKEPTTVGKYIRYGQLAYTTYGWGMCIWSLYKEPAMAKLVASGAIRAARWMFILLW